eukprot:6490314-Amphidinium_carterae.5
MSSSGVSGVFSPFDTDTPTSSKCAVDVPLPLKPDIAVEFQFWPWNRWWRSISGDLRSTDTGYFFWVHLRG